MEGPIVEGDPAAAAGHRRSPLRLTGAEWLLLLVLAAVQFTHIIDFVLVMPLGPEFQEALGLNTNQFGWMVSAYAFSASLSGLLAAWFLDRFDRKSALLVLYAGFIGGTLLCAAAPGYGVLLLGRAVAGAFAGVMAADVLAIVGDAFPDSRRGTAMGVVMSAFSVASIVGIPAGLGLANWLGWRAPFALLGGLSVVVWLLAWAVLPSLRRHLLGALNGAGSVGRVLTDAGHVRAYALMVALVLGTFVIHPYLSIFLVDNVGVRRVELPYVWLCGGIATLLTMTGFGWLSDRFGKLLIFRITAVVALVPTLLLTNLPAVPLAVALGATTLFMVMSAARMVPAMALITASAAPRYRGSFLSINASVQQMAAALGPLLSGLILGSAEGGTPLRGFSWVGILAACFMIGSVFLAGRLRPATEDAEALVETADEPQTEAGPLAATAEVPVVS
jgi:predicted MFS family arabinose efflux permease